MYTHIRPAVTHQTFLHHTQEEREEAGLAPLPEPLPSEWSEAQVKALFESERKRATARSDPISDEELKFESWFPGLSRSGTKCETPKGIVLCFHSAGGSEDVFSSEGTGVRRVPSTLLQYCKDEGLWLLAAQSPGRAARVKETPLLSAFDIARRVHAVLSAHLVCADRFLPQFVVSHSMGCWVALEYLRLRKEAGLPMPRAWCLSAMPSPDIAFEKRPWRVNKGMAARVHTSVPHVTIYVNCSDCSYQTNPFFCCFHPLSGERNTGLSDAELKVEARQWDANEVLFTDGGMWRAYEPLMRADFTVFDTYPGCYPALVGSDLEVPILRLNGAEDKRITSDLMGGWDQFSSKCEEKIVTIPGAHHMWPTVKEPKAIWLAEIVKYFKEKRNE